PDQPDLAGGGGPGRAGGPGLGRAARAARPRPRLTRTPFRPPLSDPPRPRPRESIQAILDPWIRALRYRPDVRGIDLGPPPAARGGIDRGALPSAGTRLLPTITEGSGDDGDELGRLLHLHRAAGAPPG